MIKISNLSEDYTNSRNRTITIFGKSYHWPFPILDRLTHGLGMTLEYNINSAPKYVEWLEDHFRKMKNLMWEIKWRFHPNHRYNIVKTGLKPAYYDIDTIMLHANMALLCRYVEDERHGEKELEERIKELHEMGDCKSHIEYENESLYIYRWWKKDWQLGWDDYNNKLHSLYSGHKIEDSLDPDGTFHVRTNPNALCTSDELTNLEESLYHREDEMLKRLISIRRCLWT